MKWNNAQKDKLPRDGERVLITVKGVNYVSTYHADKKQFKVEDELKETLFKADDHLIYWTDYTEPPDS